MIALKTGNLQRISPKHGLSAQELSSYDNSIQAYLNKIKDRNLGFYSIVDDNKLLNTITEYSSQVKDKYSHIIILGIGGSSLGTICIQQSLTHLFKPAKLHVLDNIDPTLIKEAEETIDITKTLFIVVTKSGSTPETLSQYFYFKDKCEQKNVSIKEHFIIITDPKNGLLRKIADKESIPSFEVPENIGGRFSVLSAVGLLPASLLGLDISKLMNGAKQIRDTFLKTDPKDNLAFQLATIQYQLAKKEKTINVMTPYAQKLIRFADWYRQLLAESIGKKTNNNNQEVYTGITPVNALGATDQHSQSQLYNEGPNDKLHIFIKVKNLSEEIAIPNLYPDEESIKYIKNLSFNKLIETEMEGTIEALTQNDRPNITIEIDEINEETLGGLFMLFEGATAFLGELFDINAFDQPGVELSKQITTKLLSNNA